MGKTDLERFIELYKSIGIDNITIREDENTLFFSLGVENYSDDTFDKNEKIKGYYGFYTKLTFTKEGTFIKQEIFE